MKAVIYTEYGSPDVLQFKTVEKPTPKDDEVLVKVYAAALNAADWRLMRAEPFLVRLMGGGILRPTKQILGSDIAGRVEAVGSSVTQFKPGDEVYGDLSAVGNGGFAEYVCAREAALAVKPANLTFEEAAAVPMAAVTALQGLRDQGHVQKGQRVLINGASGGVGTFAAQIAKAFGAEVTAVCSTRHVDKLRSLGIDHVIDYTQADFTKSGQRYDLIVAANGNQSIFDYRRALKPAGIQVVIGGGMSQLFQAMLMGPLLSLFGGQKFGSLMAKPNRQDLDFMRGLLESGKVIPIIDRCYPLSEFVDAMRYLEEGHARGKIVITVAQTNPA